MQHDRCALVAYFSHKYRTLVARNTCPSQGVRETCSRVKTAQQQERNRASRRAAVPVGATGVPLGQSSCELLCRTCAERSRERERETRVRGRVAMVRGLPGMSGRRLDGSPPLRASSLRSSRPRCGTSFPAPASRLKAPAGRRSGNHRWRPVYDDVRHPPPRQDCVTEAAELLHA